ncbi:hypothetical protein LCGC14_0773690 [marine sediment metagenome]|uniref:Major capsid protein n=1 Tax=marine sediment metagenome TaxID=412755 RepID=A0A0F9QHF2_9ZZZZ
MAEHTLIDVMSTIEEDKKLAAVKRVVQSSNMISMFETDTIPSGSSTVYVEGDLDNPGYVDYNSVAADTKGTPDDPQTTHLKKMQTRISLDRVLAMRATKTGESYKRRQITKSLRALGLNWNRFIIGRGTAGSGITAAKQPLGLYGQVNRWEKDDTKNVLKINFGNQSIATAGIAVFQNKMSQLFDAVYWPDFCLCKRQIVNNIKNLVETGAVTERFASKVTFEFMGVQGLNAKVPILHYEKVPIIAVDRDSQNNEIFIADEDTGGANTSILAIRSNEDDGVVLLREYQDMFDIVEYTQNGNEVVEITGPNNIEARGPRCVARMNEITPS